jgi:hypothetical protein
MSDIELLPVQGQQVLSEVHLGHENLYLPCSIYHLHLETLKGNYTNEPCHDKTNIVPLRPAWFQTSLRISSETDSEQHGS